MATANYTGTQQKQRGKNVDSGSSVVGGCLWALILNARLTQGCFETAMKNWKKWFVCCRSEPIPGDSEVMDLRQQSHSQNLLWKRRF